MDAEVLNTVESKLAELQATIAEMCARSEDPYSIIGWCEGGIDAVLGEIRSYREG